MSEGSSNCIFCVIARGEDPKTELLFENEDLVVFRDMKPATTHHYLVCTKEHIKNAKVLNGSHIPLVEQMRDVGMEVLEKQGGDLQDARVGFHWPPVTLITHLHLHVMSPDSSLSFLSRTIFAQGWWFVTVEWMINRLKNMTTN